MNLRNTLFLFLAVIIASCTTGEKALQKGNYYQAINKAVERLKSDPDNAKATKVLREGYPLALDWSQEEIDLALSSNQAFKWERTIDIMLRVNSLARQIRNTPAARKIISSPKTYDSTLNMAYEKAAEQRYLAGVDFMQEPTRESARKAYEHFQKADKYIPGYKDVIDYMQEAKELATYKVIVEAVTVRTKTYKLTSEFFYNQVFEYLNNKYPERGFVNFYSPMQAERFEVTQPDFVVRMEFYDFSVGNLIRSEKEQVLTKRVKIETKDTTRVAYKTYRAKLKTYSDEVISGGRLSYRIVDFRTNKLMRDNLIPGSFTWVNEYALFVGDEEALNDQQYALTQNKAVPLPPHQDLFIEFTRPIYEELTREMHQFFRRYR